MSATAPNVHAPITGGDSKFELFAQLFDVGRIRKHAPWFQVDVGHPTLFGSAAPWAKLNLHVQGIVAEDGSGNAWMISGYVDREIISTAALWVQSMFPNGRNHFKAYYNTRTRSGTIIVE